MEVTPGFIYEREWRHTTMGGLTLNIAVCSTCGCRYVEPYSLRRSRRGTHGSDYYIHPHPLTFLVLYRSNSGRCDYYIDGALEDDESMNRLKKLGEMWKIGLVGVADIIYELRGEESGE